MRRYLFFLIPSLLIVGFIFWFFFFSTYEVRMEYEKLSNGNYQVKTIPLNSLGRIVPLKKASCKYIVKSDNAIIVEEDTLKGTVIIKPDSSNSEIKLSAKSNFSLWTNLIIIPQKNPGES